MSALSECSRSEVWQSQQWQGALSLSAKRAVWPDVPAQLCVSWLFAHSQATDSGDDAQWEWDTGYCARAAGRSKHSDEGIKKKPPASRGSTKAWWKGVVWTRSRSQ